MSKSNSKKTDPSRRLAIEVLLLLALGGANVAWLQSLGRSRRQQLPNSAPVLPPRVARKLPPIPSDWPYADEDICSISFSLVGNYLVSGGIHNQLSLWDPHTGKTLFSWSGPPQGGFADIGFCSDTSWIATISPNRGVKFWTPGKNLGTGETRFKEVTFNEFVYHPTCVAFKPLTSEGISNSSTIVALALGDNTIRILEFDPQARPIPKDILALRTNDPRASKVPELFRQIAKIEGHTAQINDLSFSHDGSILVSVSEDASVRVWDAVNWQNLRVLHGHTAGVNTVSFSGDDSRFATTSDDHSILVWNRNTMNQSAALKGHSDAVLGAEFCGNSRWLVSTSVDRKLLVWSLEHNSEIGHLLGENPGQFAGISASADGQYIASTWGREIRFWKTSEILAEAEQKLQATKPS